MHRALQGSRCSQHALHIPCNQVNLQVHQACGLQTAQRGVFHRVRNQVDADVAACGGGCFGFASFGFFGLGFVDHAVYRQAHAVDSDGAFKGQKPRQPRRNLNLQLPAFAHLGKTRDRAHAVHMAANDVPTQAVVGAQGFFQVHRAGLGQPTRMGQRLGRHVYRELVAVKVDGGGRHASAVDGNAVAQGHVGQITGRAGNAEAFAMGRRAA